jgi:tetratricopeptide (TPR) repeat protein
VKKVWVIVKLPVLTILCGAAVVATCIYRVPGPAAFVFLPWIGIGLTGLSVVTVLARIVRRAEEDDPLRRAILILERVDTVLIAAFLCHALFLVANALGSPSDIIVRQSEVLARGRRQADSRLLDWAELRSWDERPSRRVLLYPRESQALWGGRPVLVAFHPGLFNQPWIVSIEPDEERQLKGVLAAVPTAGQVWRRLVDFYIRQQRYTDAIAAGTERLKVYPNDLDFAMHLAGALFNANYHPNAVPILEPFLPRHPTADVQRMLGFAMFRAGRKAEGAALMQKAIEQRPDDIHSYYMLGYAYFYAGDMQGALPWFERLLQLNPNYPEIQERVRAIRGTPASPRP